MTAVAHELAQLQLLRAESDAELALALAKQAALQAEAAEAVKDVKKLKGKTK